MELSIECFLYACGHLQFSIRKFQVFFCLFLSNNYFDLMVVNMSEVWARYYS